jgi:hypothetical protein
VEAKHSQQTSFVFHLHTVSVLGGRMTLWARKQEGCPGYRMRNRMGIVTGASDTKLILAATD